MSVRIAVIILALVHSPFVSAQEPGDPPRPRVVSTPTPSPRKNTAKPKPPVKRPVRTPAELVKGYMPSVKAALAARWAGQVTPRMSEFTTGDLSVTFILDAEGKVTGVTVVTNTSNEPFAKFCCQFLRETKFEPPPSRALADGQLEIPFTFTIY